MSDIKQFKLISGEEIICEVVEWATEQYADLVVKRCFQIFSASDKDGSRFYSFRPWMALQEGTNTFITINNNHIIAEANPVDNMIKHYKDAVKHSEMTVEEVEERIQKMIKKINALNDSDDTDDTVIRFPSKPIMH